MQLVEGKEKIKTLFQYMLMYHMKIRGSTKRLVLCYPKYTTVDLTTTSNSKNVQWIPLMMKNKF